MLAFGQGVQSLRHLGRRLGLQLVVQLLRECRPRVVQESATAVRRGLAISARPTFVLSPRSAPPISDPLCTRHGAREPRRERPVLGAHERKAGHRTRHANGGGQLVPCARRANRCVLVRVLAAAVVALSHVPVCELHRRGVNVAHAFEHLRVSRARGVCNGVGLVKVLPDGVAFARTVRLRRREPSAFRPSRRVVRAVRAQDPRRRRGRRCLGR